MSTNNERIQIALDQAIEALDEDVVAVGPDLPQVKAGLEEARRLHRQQADEGQQRNA